VRRHPFGINLDAGVPLVTQEDFDLLFVDAYEAASARIQQWLAAGEDPLVVGGQIGSGKTTLLERGMLVCGRRADIEVRLDLDVVRTTAGGFWRALLVSVLQAGMACGVDFARWELPQELASLAPDDWEGLVRVLQAHNPSLEHAGRRRCAEDDLEEATEAISAFLDEVHRALQARLGRRPVVLASGLDKLAPGRAPLHLAEGVLRLLRGWKTLFECNSVQLFVAGPLSKLDRVVIAGMGDDAIEEALGRRLGCYRQAREAALSDLVRLSGGNPRQMVRFLGAFERAKTDLQVTDEAAAGTAVREVSRDLFAFSEAPDTELLRAVRSDRGIGAGIVAGSTDQESARLALYGNWILIRGEPREGTLWPAIPNPLLDERMSYAAHPEEPEAALLRQYAHATGMSEIGLDLGVVAREEPEALRDAMARILEQEVTTKIADVLDALSAALLVSGRHDPAMLVFRSPALVTPISEALFAAANTYEPHVCVHRVVRGTGRQQAPPDLLDAVRETADVLSLELVGDWSDDEILAIDRLREELTRFETLLWVPAERAPIFLRRWDHLRQMARLVVLDDEVLEQMSRDDVQADLAAIEDLVDAEDTPFGRRVGHLRALLKHLETRRGGRK